MNTIFRTHFLVSFFTLLITISFSAHAIDYSVVGIGNISQLKQSQPSPVVGDGLLGFGGGLLLEFQLTSFIGFESGLLYHKRSFGFEDDNFEGAYIQIPLLFRIWLSSRWNFSLGLFTDLKSGDIQRTFNGTSSTDDEFSSFDYGWTAALGYIYPIGVSTGFISEIRYQTDLSNRSTASTLEYKLTDIQLFFGLRFGLHGGGQGFDAPLPSGY